MSDDKSAISQAQTYQDIGQFWDTHDLTDYWDQTEAAEFTVDIQSEAAYYAVELTLAAKLGEAARRRGVSADTLLNLWLQERLQHQAP